jgi:putative ABC transport system substrate-binding protein
MARCDGPHLDSRPSLSGRNASTWTCGLADNDADDPKLTLDHLADSQRMQLYLYHLKRRDFITLLGGAASWPLLAPAQQPAGRVRRIGFVAGATRPAALELSPYFGFLEGMKELGYLEGRDFVVEWRFAEGQYDRFTDFATEFARLKVDLIFTALGIAVAAMQEANPGVPIVMGYSVDPVGLGLVASLARPGGHTTGLASAVDQIMAKQVDLLLTAVPHLTRIAVLTNPANPASPAIFKNVEAAAHQAGVGLLPVKARHADEIARVFDTLSKERAGAIIVSVDALFFARRQQIVDLALRNRLASIFGNRDYAQAGGLMSYGESLHEFYRRAATFVDKIFKGAKPRDLPIEQPTKFNFVINRKTADALGLTIPAQLYIFADEVIE